MFPGNRFQWYLKGNIIYNMHSYDMIHMMIYSTCIHNWISLHHGTLRKITQKWTKKETDEHWVHCQAEKSVVPTPQRGLRVWTPSPTRLEAFMRFDTNPSFLGVVGSPWQEHSLPSSQELKYTCENFDPQPYKPGHLPNELKKSSPVQ